VPLQGLEVPTADAEDEVLQSDAARLFVAQATLAHPRFNARKEATAVANLVRAVGGMPLAILLAAGWVRLLPIADMVSDVTRLLDVLERAEEGDERPEHRSVRATLEQSWRLLSPAEQQLLMVLSVFAGTCTRAAVHDVSQAPLPLLGSLIDKSLVQIDGAARCSLHPLIQQFAAHKLAADDALSVATRDQHAASYARLMQQFLHFNSIDQSAALRTIAAELSNILVAWDWAITQQRGDWLSQCASGLSNYFQAHGPLNVGLKLFARAEAAVAGSRASASDAKWALPLEAASLSYWLGDYRAVEAAGRRALAAAREKKSGYAIRFSLNSVGLAVFRQGRVTEADRYLSEALKRARAENLPEEVASFAGNLVAIKRDQGDNVRALELVNESLEGHRRNGHLIGELSMLNELGLLLHSSGRVDEAIEAFTKGSQLAEVNGLASRQGTFMTHCASALLDKGDIDEARAVGREALRLLVEKGMVGAEPACRRTLVAIESAAGNVDAAREQLIEAIAISRRIATPPVVAPTLWEGADFLERFGDPVVALRLTACADTAWVTRLARMTRHRNADERLRARLDADAIAAAEAAGAALSLDAGLDQLTRAIEPRS
ncbi:MAG: ATP-binding protein, partial [Burkholderiaceae bacterium]